MPQIRLGTVHAIGDGSDRRRLVRCLGRPPGASGLGIWRRGIIASVWLAIAIAREKKRAHLEAMTSRCRPPGGIEHKRVDRA